MRIKEIPTGLMVILFVAVITLTFSLLVTFGMFRAIYWDWHGMDMEGNDFELRSPLTLNDVTELVTDSKDDTDDVADFWSVSIRPETPFELSYRMMDIDIDGDPDEISVGSPRFLFRSVDRDKDLLVDQQIIVLPDVYAADVLHIYIDLDRDGRLDIWRQSIKPDNEEPKVQAEHLRFDMQWIEVSDKQHDEEAFTIHEVMLAGKETKVAFSDGEWRELEPSELVENQDE